MNREDGRIEGATQDGQSVTADWSPVGRQLIDGVRLVDIRSVPKRGGFLTEIARPEWLDGSVVGQVFQVTLAPGSISAWHAHAETTDRLFVSVGQITLALYDARETSPTFRLVNELQLDIHRPQLVVVPPGVWHGLLVGGTTPAILLNLTDRPYSYESPDHWRLPSDTDKIPYSFTHRRTALDGNSG